MRVIWDETNPISPSLAVINEIGYEAKPYRQDITHEAMLARHTNQMLLRLGIAALGSMRAMMYAVAIYFGEYSDMLVFQRDFCALVSLFSVPRFLLCWFAFYLQRGRKPVVLVKSIWTCQLSIALVVTFFASLYAYRHWARRRTMIRSVCLFSSYWQGVILSIMRV